MKTIKFPNVFIRSNLFTTSKNIKTIDKEINSQKNYTIILNGEQFNQNDCLILQSCLYLIQKTENSECFANYNSINYIINKKNGGSSNKLIDKSLDKLSKNKLTIKLSELIINGSILSYKKDNKGLHLKLNSDFISLFNNDFTFIDIDKKTRLNSDLSKWIFDYLSSHKINKTSLSIDYIQRLCGNNCLKYEFKRLLKKSLDQITESDFKINNYTLTDKIEFNLIENTKDYSSFFSD